MWQLKMVEITPYLFEPLDVAYKDLSAHGRPKVFINLVIRWDENFLQLILV